MSTYDEEFVHVSVSWQASASHAFNHRYSWLLLHEAPNSSLQLLDAVEMLPDSDVTWLAPGEVLDVYRVKTGQPLIVTPLQMTRNDSLEEMRSMWSELLPTARRRQNLRNVYLSAAVVVGGGRIEPDSATLASDGFLILN